MLGLCPHIFFSYLLITDINDNNLSLRFRYDLLLLYAFIPHTFFRYFSRRPTIAMQSLNLPLYLIVLRRCRLTQDFVGIQLCGLDSLTDSETKPKSTEFILHFLRSFRNSPSFKWLFKLSLCQLLLVPKGAITYCDSTLRGEYFLGSEYSLHSQKVAIKVVCVNIVFRKLQGPLFHANAAKHIIHLIPLNCSPIE